MPSAKKVISVTALDKNALIVKSNQLINASYKLTLQEQRVIIFLASLIRKDDEDFRLYKIKTKDFAEIVQIKNKDIYKELQLITAKLKSRELTIIKENGLPLQMNWLASADYYKGYIELELSVKLKPYLLQLKEHFTKYQLKNIIGLKSSYAIRIYEILKSHQYKGEVYFKLEDLKAVLGIPKSKYSKYTNFRIKILEKSKEELNEKSDITFNFEPKKQGRKIIGIWFFIKHKEDTKKSDKIANIELYSELQDYYCLTPEQAKKVLKEYERNPEKIRANLEYVAKRYKSDKIKNIAPYTLKAIKENYKIQKTFFDKDEKEKTEKLEHEEALKLFKDQLPAKYREITLEAIETYKLDLEESYIKQIEAGIKAQVEEKHKKNPYAIKSFIRIETDRHWAKEAQVIDFDNWEKEQIKAFNNSYNKKTSLPPPK